MKKTEKYQALIVNPLEDITLKQEGKQHKIQPADLIYLYQNHSIIYAVVNKVVNNLMLDGYYFIKDEEEVIDSTTEYIENVFKSTNNDQSIILTMREVIRDMLIVGDSYLEYVKLGRVEKIDHISPKYMRKRITKTGEILGYGQWINGKWEVIFQPEEIFTEGLNNGDVYGISPIQASYREILTDLGAIVFNKKFFENDATPQTVWILDENIKSLPDDRIQTIKKQLLESYQSSHNSNKPVMNSVIKDVKIIERDLNKLQFTETRDKFIEKLCSAFDMSKSVIGITDSANESTASQTMKKQFYETSIMPKEQTIERFMNNEILPRLGFGEYKFKIRERDFEDKKDKVITVTEMRKAGLVTENEARTMLGLPRIEEDWADMYSVLTPQGYIPVDTEPELNQEQKGILKRVKDLIKK